MPLALSVYFEIVRFTAALVVLLSHAWPIFFPASPLPWPGHDAVVVFFVLSGYVISHASETKDTTLWRYVLSRTSRILCVTIPALLLGAVVAVYVGTPAADIAIPSLLNAVFLGQSWTLNVGPPENAPYWSLCYEVWYYAIFGAAFYLTGSKRWIAIAVASLLAGPKILLLMPCWLIGVALHRNISRFRRSNVEAAYLFIGSAIVYLVFFWFDASIAIRRYLEAPLILFYLRASNQFIGDTILAIVVALNFIAVAKFQENSTHALVRIRPVAAWFAGATLSFYLFHYPLLQFSKANGYTGALSLVALIGMLFLLASVTERRRKGFRDVLERAFAYAPDVPLPESARLGRAWGFSERLSK